MIAYTKSRLRYLIRLDFVRFCVVGGTGFVINFIILATLQKGFGVPTFIAQIIGAEVALLSNFMLHHHWTYKTHMVKKSMSTLLVQFHASTWPAILGSAVIVTAGEKLLHLSALVALIVSSVILLFWNFGWSKYVIWRDVTPAEVEEIAE